MSIQPVQNETTDQQITDYFNSGSQNPPPFMKPGPSVVPTSFHRGAACS